jgi:hypothetical protein
MSLDFNVESIILLLFFIAPGFLFTRTYTAYRPRYYREPNSFEQFVMAIVGSTIIHAIILSFIALGLLLYWLIAGGSVYLENIFDPTLPIGSYSIPILALIMFINIIYLAASLVLARRLATFLGRRIAIDRPRWWKTILGDDPPEPFLLWHSVLQIEPFQLNLIPPQLAIQLRNGEYFEGDLYRMRLVGDEENTVELALRNVFRRLPASKSNDEVDTASLDLEPLTNQVILLKSTDILWLTRNDIPR